MKHRFSNVYIGAVAALGGLCFISTFDIRQTASLDPVMFVFIMVLAGVALRCTRPKTLRQLLDWADVTLVEFPWQVAHVARLEPTGPIVLASHNVEVQKFASYADAARAHVTRGPPLRTRRAHE